MSKIYTRRGDNGKTKLANGEETYKYAARVEALGALDELEALLGIAMSQEGRESTEQLRRVQHEVLSVASEIGLGEPPSPIDKDHVKALEAEIDEETKEMPALNEFILRGGAGRGAHLHLACAVCRRAERAVSAVNYKTARHYARPEILQYMNRLGDWLFVMARAENRHLGTPEPVWEK